MISNIEQKGSDRMLRFFMTKEPLITTITA